jgi:hypothetical protein
MSSCGMREFQNLRNNPLINPVEVVFLDLLGLDDFVTRTTWLGNGDYLS